MQQLLTFKIRFSLLNLHSESDCNDSGVHLEAEACPFWQVLDLDVKLQPAVPEHLFSEGFRGRPLLSE